MIKCPCSYWRRLYLAGFSSDHLILTTILAFPAGNCLSSAQTPNINRMSCHFSFTSSKIYLDNLNLLRFVPIKIKYFWIDMKRLWLIVKLWSVFISSQSNWMTLLVASFNWPCTLSQSTRDPGQAVDTPWLLLWWENWLQYIVHSSWLHQIPMVSHIDWLFSTLSILILYEYAAFDFSLLIGTGYPIKEGSNTIRTFLLGGTPCSDTW